MTIFQTLLEWSPAFTAGFGYNLLISMTAMLLGTAIGIGLGFSRYSNRAWLSHAALSATNLFRNIPSFIFMFYIAFLIPVEFEWNETLVRFPLWMKAAMALTIPVVGFTSDQVLRFIKDRASNPIAFQMLFLSWSQYFVIILMASSTSSVIGVADLVGRANTAIAVIGADAPTMLVVYSFVALWFVCTAALLNALLKIISVRLNQRVQAA